MDPELALATSTTSLSGGAAVKPEVRKRLDELWARQQRKLWLAEKKKHLDWDLARKAEAELEEQKVPLDWEAARAAELEYMAEEYMKKETEEKEKKEAKLMEEYHDLKWNGFGEGEEEENEKEHQEEVETEKEQEVEENYEEEEMTQEEWKKGADESEELDPRWEEMGAHYEMLESEAMMAEDTAALAVRQKECYLTRADEFE